jgi:hypothetical protein
MVESVAKLAQVQREEFPRRAAQRMQLGFRRAPEPFDAIEGIAPVGSAALFAPADMVTADGERGLGVPVIGGGEATGPGMGLDPFNYLLCDRAVPGPAPRGPVRGIAGSSARGLYRPRPSRVCQGVCLQRSFRRARRCQQTAHVGAPSSHTRRGSHATIARGPEHWSACGSAAERRAPQHEHLPRAPRHGCRQTTGLPDRGEAVPACALLALQPPVGQLPGSRMSAARTSLHCWISLHLVQFG